MKSKKLSAVRYQLNKEALNAVSKKHPWIFRSHLSTAANSFTSGQWLRLYDHQNKVVGTGIFETDGAVAIRILEFGPEPVSPRTLEDKIERALQQRTLLSNYTDGFRVLHGENDGVPGVTFDVYGHIGVLQTYYPSVDVLGRYLAYRLRHRLNLSGVLWKMPTKRTHASLKSHRTLFGNVISVIAFREGKRKIHVEPYAGQKTGFFLDLRNLRKWLSEQPRPFSSVLNLFSYTGTLGQACMASGTQVLWNVDTSAAALRFSQKYHFSKSDKVEFIEADVFEWLKKPPTRLFDLVIVDPPQLVSQMEHIRNALNSFKKLISHASHWVKPGGTLVVACCTSRIDRKLFSNLLRDALGRKFSLERELSAESDHPVSFKEGDYLKISILKRKG